MGVIVQVETNHPSCQIWDSLARGTRAPKGQRLIVLGLWTSERLLEKFTAYAEFGCSCVEQLLKEVSSGTKFGWGWVSVNHHGWAKILTTLMEI